MPLMPDASPQQTDPEVLQKTYDFETNPPGFTRDLKVTDAGLQGEKLVLCPRGRRRSE